MAMQTNYPRRESHHAHKLIRLMMRTCAAQEIGCEAVVLVTYIAHTEDSKRYTAPVTFWNEQLQSVLGFTWGKLARARKKAVDAGWLHYESGGKGKVGKYWTTTPNAYSDLPDGSVECDYPHAFLFENEEENEGQTRDKRGTNEGQTRDKCGTFIPIPIPNPIPNNSPSESVEQAASDFPHSLEEVCSWWRDLHAGGLVPAGVSDKPNKAVREAWRKAMKDREQRDRLKDLDAIRDEIERSPFCQRPWFTLAKLIWGNNRTGEPILDRLLTGGYRDGARASPQPARREQMDLSEIDLD